ncbi:hypothetical protein HELRODRAFT_167111 [Helobdella robusta]|uniref:Uncharacterized protein n=1 Tax=Helobdella robusta TaxID=6412 RepID=T1EZ11_HELRO|nr:hypothetical protein HELRODRAFT_167111 [Helobdella robusta]ESO10605.1 hypothetical protein HELRODRAFT_167111 [Helobdella robusta]
MDKLVLKNFLNVVVNFIGRDGRTKLVQLAEDDDDNNNNVALVCSSFKLFNQLLIHNDNKLVKFILSAILRHLSHHHDGGVMNAFLDTKLKKLGIDESDSEMFKIKLLEGFLKSIKGQLEFENSYRIIVLPDKKPNLEVDIINGCLLEPYEEPFKHQIRYLQNRKLNILLFSCFLDENLNNSDIDCDINLKTSNNISLNKTQTSLIIDSFKKIMANLKNIDIIACQKVASPDIKLFLKSLNVLLIDRLGKEQINFLVRVTHAKLIKSPIESITNDHLGKIGELKVWKATEDDEKEYLEFISDFDDFVSIVIFNPYRETFEEVKYLSECSFKILKNLYNLHTDSPNKNCQLNKNDVYLLSGTDWVLELVKHLTNLDDEFFGKLIQARRAVDSVKDSLKLLLNNNNNNNNMDNNHNKIKLYFLSHENAINTIRISFFISRTILRASNFFQETDE